MISSVPSKPDFTARPALWMGDSDPSLLPLYPTIEAKAFQSRKVTSYTLFPPSSRSCEIPELLKPGPSSNTSWTRGCCLVLLPPHRGEAHFTATLPPSCNSGENIDIPISCRLHSQVSPGSDSYYWVLLNPVKTTLICRKKRYCFLVNVAESPPEGGLSTWSHWGKCIHATLKPRVSQYL